MSATAERCPCAPTSCSVTAGPAERSCATRAGMSALVGCGRLASSSTRSSSCRTSTSASRAVSLIVVSTGSMRSGCARWLRRRPSAWAASTASECAITSWKSCVRSARSRSSRSSDSTTVVRATACSFACSARTASRSARAPIAQPHRIITNVQLMNAADAEPPQPPITRPATTPTGIPRSAAPRSVRVLYAASIAAASASSIVYQPLFGATTAAETAPAAAGASDHHGRRRASASADPASSIARNPPGPSSAPSASSAPSTRPAATMAGAHGASRRAADVILMRSG